MQYKMQLFEKPYKALETGKKTIELRLYDEKRRKVCEGDTIVFYLKGNSNCFIETKVVRIYRFESFSALYQHLPLEKCGYSEEEIMNADPDDMNEFYSPEEQVKYGVVGIEVEKIKQNLQ